MSEMAVATSSQAVYTPQKVKAYQGIPTIEALPPLMSEDDVIDRLTNLPEYHETERDDPTEVRRHSLASSLTKGFYQPLEQHLIIEQMISMIIRQGYIGRNPLTPGYKTLVGGQYVEQFSGIPMGNQLVPPSNVSSQGGSVIGISGVGKSSAVESILSQYPQKIVHTQYEGRELPLEQLVWIKIDCPDDGSINDLCILFFDAVDKALGTRYYLDNVKKGRVTRSYLTEMNRVALKHQLGILVVDEIQRLSNAKSGGAAKILDFFMMLVNTIGVPVFMIGTPAAEKVLPSNFQQARRVAGHGSLRWTKMEKDSEEWKLFVDAMWVYQWTRKAVPLTKDMRDALYDSCQGIAVLAVSLYEEVQIQAMRDMSETFGPDSFRKVLEKRFFFMVPMIRALRENDEKAIHRYDDISFKMLREEGQYPERETETLRKEERERSIADLTVERLREAGVPPEKARLYVEKVKEQKIPANRYFNQAFRMYIRDEDEKEKENLRPEGDIRSMGTGQDPDTTIDRADW